MNFSIHPYPVQINNNNYNYNFIHLFMPSSMKSSASIQIMLSRSSSAYQPLEGGVAAGESSSASAGGGGGANINNGRSNNGGSSAVGPQQHHYFEEENGTEMTSIAVISSHPLRSGGGSVNTQILNASNKPPDDFSNLCVSEEKSSWTNFHFVMCIGILGFFVFWIVLLCRMYLPNEYQFWNLGSSSSSSGGAPVVPSGQQAQILPAKVDILDSLPNLGE